MLHGRITNKLTNALIYAVLEWTLIFLLLINSLFSFFIIKFANYFGLKPPCFLCSRLDLHFLNKNKTSTSTLASSSYADIFCEQHAAEISRIGYCSNHRKLVESQRMCHDCCSDANSDGLFEVKRCSCCDVIIKMPSLDHVVINQRELQMGSDSDPQFGYLALDTDETREEKKQEKEEEKDPLLSDDKEIGVSVQNLCADMLPQHLEFYIDHDDYRLIPVELVNKGEICKDFELVLEGDELVPPCVEVVSKSLPCIEEMEDELEELNQGEDSSRERKLEIERSLVEEWNKIDEVSLHSLQEEVAVEEKRQNETEISKLHLGEICLVDPKSEEKRENETEISHHYLEEATLQDEEEVKRDNETEISEFCQEEDKIQEKNLATLKELELEEKEMEEESRISQPCKEEEIEREDVGVFQGKEENHSVEELIIWEEQEEDKTLEPTDMYFATSESPEEDATLHLRGAETGAETNDDVTELLVTQVEEPSTPRKQESPSVIDNVVCEVSTSSAHSPSVDEHDDNPTVSESEAENSRRVEIRESLNVNVIFNHNEVEEDRVPDTPTSVDSLNNLHKKLMLLGRRESTTEESLDGSMISEPEIGEGAGAIEKLKSELQAERKTLRALFKELEEERNAAAIATNQTMAMITRLQEEKATMQMEALQYQRMMEEQSEYDQEALQMMNELMVKREKEKLELEKELEVYRKKIIDYEEREKMRILSRRRDGSMRSRNSSAPCSFAGDESDGLSIDLNHEAKDQEEDSTSSPHSHDENGHQDTPTDAVLCLQDSLASFEAERHAILEQLKVLEGKLFTLAEEEEEHFENMKPFEQFYEENGKYFEDGCQHELTLNDNDNGNGGGENGFSHANGKHHPERRINGSMQKRLLPLFDAAELSESTDLNGKEYEYDSMEFQRSPITKFEIEKKRLAIEGEVDNFYERLQAFEADREFLKHCVGSLRKGDKGLDLLQEILQHLRDLKNVELQLMKNIDSTCASV